MCETCKTEDNPEAKGSAFTVHHNIKECVTDFRTSSNRIIKTKLNLQGKDSVTVINTYGPTSSAEGENVEQFTDDIERVMTKHTRSFRLSSFA